MLNLDTHVLLFALTGQLRRQEALLLEQQPWSISAISLWEIAKLAQLRRIDMGLDDKRLRAALERIHVWPLSLEVCRQSVDLDFDGDPADELIAATSMVYDAPLVTRDRRIRASKRVPLAGM